jgi:hypothetical protein
MLDQTLDKEAGLMFTSNCGSLNAESITYPGDHMERSPTMQQDKHRAEGSKKGLSLEFKLLRSAHRQTPRTSP